MPNGKIRVVGSGFTTFNYRGQPIAFMDQIRDTGQRPFGTGMQGVIPIGANHPVEIVTGQVIDMGTITLTIRELWNEPVWYQLAGLRGVGETITDVWRALNADPSAVSCQMIIKPPATNIWRGKTYHNVVITDVDDSETVTVGELSVARTVSMAYTHKTNFTQPAQG